MPLLQNRCGLTIFAIKADFALLITIKLVVEIEW